MDQFHVLEAEPDSDTLWAFECVWLSDCQLGHELDREDARIVGGVRPGDGDPRVYWLIRPECFNLSDEAALRSASLAEPDEDAIAGSDPASIRYTG